MSAADLLIAARQTRGWSQRELAVAANTPQPRIADIESGKHDTSVSRLEELLRALGQRSTLIPTHSRPVWEAAVAVRTALEAGNENRAFREIVGLADDLERESASLRVALSVATPPPVGDRRYDALIAAVTDYRLSGVRAPLPEWVRAEHYRLSPPWHVGEVPSLRESAAKRTPAAIRRHGIYLDAAELESV